MAEPRTADGSADGTSGQRIVRVAGARRARLTPAPGSDPAPESAVKESGERRSGPQGPRGPNDERMMQDVPPHY
nr:hypothetical protein [uncultured Microbacterium sp.]